MSEAQHIQFELVSPEERLISEPVKMAIIPGAEGVFGVGVGHESVVSELKPGVVALYGDKEGEEPRRIFIAGGFADVTGELCTVLAEEAVNVNDLNKKDLEQQIKDLNEDFGLAAEEVDKTRIQSGIVMAEAKLKATTAQ